ncbi:MAG: family 16 glycosylhydrolase [Gammaproteobacteria bacterium]|nr:family 16 glycosylhydrolase [Gammaproteobacteria bacterium]
MATALMLSGCAEEDSDAISEWAVNVGGPSYLGVEGTRYAAEQSVSGGTVGQISVVKGSQDRVLYQSYREGDIEIAHRLANGIYDITFHFAEPANLERDERIFSVFVEEQPIIKAIDVMLWRDGKVRSALTVTVPGVEVADGTLNIGFAAQKRSPILSALTVSRQTRTDDSRELVWSDEFDKDGAPNPANWNIEEWASGVVNDEDQVYTSRPNNVRVEDGHLVIEAHKEEYEGGQYTSGRLQSSGKADFLYGRIEVRARLPEGRGTWPAIWMLSSRPFTYATTCQDYEDWQGSDDCDAWPNSGEIDIMEHVGYQMGHVHGTVHSKAFHWTVWNQRKGRILVDDVANEFHVYSLEWSPDRIDIFVDDTVYLTYINEGNGWEEWPFDQPFHMILNLAIGGAWGKGGGPIDDSIFPQRMLVDYVRVYQPRQ